MIRKISQNGIDLIQSFEGCSLAAYKPVSTEKYWTIGYGHYGVDVLQGSKITQEQAESMFVNDLFKYVSYVNNPLYCPVTDTLNQNQFDALVSFCYNCGVGSLQGLCKGKTIEEIGNDLLLYNKGGGNVLQGLVKRRKTEQELYLKKEVIGLDDKIVDYILIVLGDYWKRMDGNTHVQNYTHFVANQLRKSAGRKEE